VNFGADFGPNRHQVKHAMQMSSARPYLLRAMHEWITANDLTAYILVNSNWQGVVVPEGYAVDGKIVLNISETAVRALSIGNDGVHFSARFHGQPQEIHVPMGAIVAIYAKENGQGMVFNDDAPSTPTPESPAKGKPRLTVVK
jgi:stringent starvation protein B